MAPFTSRSYPCVIDASRDVKFVSSLPAVDHTNKPFGQLIYIPPKDPEFDPITGEITNAFVPREPSAAVKRLMTLPHFEPHDKVRTEIVFVEHSEQPSHIMVKVIIPVENCPSTMNASIIGKDLVVSFTALACNVPELTEQSMTLLYPTNEKGEIIATPDRIPAIVRRTYKFDELKSSLYVLKLTIDNTSGKIKHRNILNNHVWTHQPSRRVVQAMQAMVTHTEPFTLDIYICDDRHTTLCGSLLATIQRLVSDRSNGSIWQHVHGKKLGPTAETVQFNAGSFKAKDTRPETDTNPVLSYHDKIEMCTRQALAQVQVKESREIAVRSLNCLGAVVRVLEVTGAGDRCYYGILSLNSAVGSESASKFRFDEGDRLKINFRTKVKELVQVDDWDFQVLKPYAFMLQGEIVGLLIRPRVPLPPDPTEEDKKKGRPLVKMNLPVKKVDAHTLEEARDALESATPVRCTITYNTSVKSETRLVAGMDIILNSSRPNIGKKSDNEPSRFHSESVESWGDFLLMKDARVTEFRDLLPAKASKDFMGKFTDADQVNVKQYLEQAPITHNGKCLAIIRGGAGCGKSSFMADLVVAKLLGEPEHRIVVVASSNQPIDVFIEKINLALAEAKLDPEHAITLRNRIAIRVYNDKSETKYLLSMADKKRLETLEQVRAAVEAEELEENLGMLAAAFPDAVTEPVKINNLTLTPATSDQPFKINTVTSEDEDNSDDSEDNGGGAFISDGEQTHTCKDKKKKKKKKKEKSKGPSKGARRAAALFKARQEQQAKNRTDVHTDYTANDKLNAITLSDDAYAGTDNKLLFYGNTLEGGVIDLASDKLPAEKLAAMVSVSMVNQLNRQIAPPATGVHDNRFTIADMGVASNALMYARDHREDSVCIDFLKKLDDYKQQGSSMEKEAHKELTESIKQVFALVKKRADVQGATANSLGHASNGVAMGEVDLLIIDEIGMMTFAEFCLVVASIDVNDIIGVGDEAQLQPMVPMVLPAGCTREIGQSILRYFLLNHWPTESLNLQRRGVPGIMKVASNLFYQGRLLDAPCTSAPEKLAKAIQIRDWFNNKFPECQSQEFFRYLLVQGHNELRDENTGSYYNLDCASVVTHLATEMIKDGIITAKQESIITHYTAQQRVYNHAFIQCDLAQPGFNFADVLNYTTDEFQGDDNLVIFGDSVRTDRQGFTSNTGRNNVMVTRAKNFFICVGNVQYLRPVNERSPPAVMKRAFDEAKKLKTCIAITVEGPHKYLLEHQFVHPRVLGTEDNVNAIQNQQLAALEKEVTEEVTESGAQQSGTWDNGAQQSGAWDNGAQQSGTWGNGTDKW